MNTLNSNSRRAEASVDDSFLNRWSPRSFKSDPISEQELMSLFESSRWAPSCYNEQPWIYICAIRDEDRKKFLSLLVGKNRIWAKNAPLLLFIATRLHFSSNGKENGSAEFDAGSAWMSLALGARKLGLYAHAMAGFDRKNAHSVLDLPKDKYKIMAAIAVGKKDTATKLPESLRKSEKPNNRKPLAQMYCEGKFHSD
jgi:nitroreductase